MNTQLTTPTSPRTTRTARSRLSLPLTLAVSALGAAALVACGGGGSSSAGLDDSTATAYAANATLINSDASTAADMAVIATQAAVEGTASVSSTGGRASAQSAGTSGGTSTGTTASPNAFTAPTFGCAGGGTADVVITGGINGSEFNGQLDADEVYTVQFDACKSSVNAAPISGNLVLSVSNATGDAANGTLGVTLATNNLTATLPRGTISLTGTSTRTAIVSTDADGTVHFSGSYTTPSLSLATNFNGRSSLFTLSATNIQRTATIVGGVVVAGTVDGTHTLSASLPRGDFRFTVSTSGSATYAADGTPTSGNWTITLPDSLVDITVASGNATITIDRSKDGTIDRTIVVPASTLQADAG